MKIVHLNFGLENGGLENMMVDIANQQSKMGHDVSIVIINNNVDESISGRINSKVHTIYFNRQAGSRSFVFIFKLLWVFNFKNNFDVLHVHTLKLGKIIRYLKSKIKVLTKHDIHQQLDNIQYFNKIFAISKSVATNILNQTNREAIVVYNGINTSDIAFNYNISSEYYNIAQVSRLNHSEKGQDILLRALKIVVQSGEIPIVKVSFIGEGESRKYLQELTSELGLDDCVEFHGNKPRSWIYQNLYNFDLFVQASRYEGFGLAVAEAMAAKVPVIVANNDGPSEVIDHGKYGYIFANSDVEDLASKIILAYKNNNEDLVNNAYEYCVNNFDISRTASRYIEEYEKEILSN